MAGAKSAGRAPAGRAEWAPAGEGRIRIEPSPELIEDITLDAFERGMLLLGIDPDAALSGGVDWTEVRRPKLRNAQAFLDLALENSEAYALREMPPAYADAFLAVVTGHFIAAARRSWQRPKSTVSA